MKRTNIENQWTALEAKEIEWRKRMAEVIEDIKRTREELTRNK